MAQTARSAHEIPRARLSRAELSRVGWTLGAIILLGLVLYAFARARAFSIGSRTSEVTLEGTLGSIRTYGSLPDLFEGNIGQKVLLSTLPSGTETVGLGSLSGLRGEIAIVRGEAWLSYPAGDHIAVERSSDEGAAFVAFAEVPRWQAQRFDDAVPFERLARVIEERARRAGIDTNRPFPVLIEGTFSAIQLNVVNGPVLGSGKSTRERMNATALRKSLSSGTGSIVGFFAAHAGERLVHAGEQLHLHVVLPDAQQVGHLDSAQIEPGSSLHLPAVP